MSASAQAYDFISINRLALAGEGPMIKHFRDLEASGFNRALQLLRLKIEGFLNQVLLWG